MSELFVKILKAFVEKLGVQLTAAPVLYNTQGGCTNTYYMVKSTQGVSYLIRINGKLWPPFTRADERFNLAELSQQKMLTNVKYSDPENLFQICELWHPSELLAKKGHLSGVAGQLGKIHDRCLFRGEYPLFSAVTSCYHKLDKITQVKYRTHFLFILSLIHVIVLDKTNFISSHNDLLPSSVYVRDQEICFVDFEYSGRNHRTYDMAFFSIKMNLKQCSEAKFIHAYDPMDEFAVGHFYPVMKTIVSFLLFCWSGGKKDEGLSQAVLNLMSIQAFKIAVFANRLNASVNDHPRRQLRIANIKHTP